jgi:hypothetical protein
MHPLLQRADRALRESAGALDVAALARGTSDQWSPAQILEHLGIAFSRTTRGLQRVVESGSPRVSPLTLSHRVAHFVVFGLRHFPSGREAPDALRPRGVDAATVFDATLASLAAMDAALDEAELRFGPSIPLMDHPVLGALSVDQWRAFHWVHTRHHARQIRGRAR